MAKEKVPGLTKSQRLWILERDGHQCCFMTYNAGTKKWERCRNKTHLQVHHIAPRGYYDAHYKGCGWDVNSPENGITLCAFHHVGDGAQNTDKPYVIHWDTRQAKRYYRGKGSKSFENMRQRRVKLNRELGRPYWNTRWDSQFRLWVEVRNKKFRRHFPYRKNPLYMQSDRTGILAAIDGTF
ncbi:MAG: HNH endonuclease signature motif containing protein [Patescibacteria group bacterium]